MNPTELVRRYWAALAAGDFEGARRHLAPEFMLHGVGARPLDRDTFLAFQRAQRAAFPDWKFNEQIASAGADVVRVRIQGTGTHLGELALPFPGAQRLPATGRALVMPAEEFDLTVVDGAITRADAHIPAGGGLQAMYAQLSGA